MNWRRGLLRVWIALSAIWSAYVVIGDLWGHVTDPIWYPPPSDLLLVPTIAVAPWLLTGAIISIRWIIRGFRH